MNRQTNQSNLTKQIAILSFPIIIENLLQALLGTVDTWFAGQFDDTAIAFSNIFAGSLQGAGDTKFPMYATFFGTWVIHIGLGYLLGIVLEMGLMGIWIGYALNNVIRSVFLYYRFRSETWTKIKL